MATTDDLTIGSVIKLDNILYLVISYEIVKPGKGGLFVRTKLKNILTQKVYDKTFNSGVKVELINLQDLLAIDSAPNKEEAKVTAKPVTKKVMEKPKPKSKHIAEPVENNSTRKLIYRLKPNAKEVHIGINNNQKERIINFSAFANDIETIEINGMQSRKIFALQGVGEKTNSLYKRENKKWVLHEFVEDPHAFDYLYEGSWESAEGLWVPDKFVDAWDLSQDLDKPIYETVVFGYQQEDTEGILQEIIESSFTKQENFELNIFLEDNYPIVEGKVYEVHKCLIAALYTYYNEPRNFNAEYNLKLIKLLVDKLPGSEEFFDEHRDRLKYFEVTPFLTGSKSDMDSALSPRPLARFTLPVFDREGWLEVPGESVLFQTNADIYSDVGDYIESLHRLENSIRFLFIEKFINKLLDISHFKIKVTLEQLEQSGLPKFKVIESYDELY